MIQALQEGEWVSWGDKTLPEDKTIKAFRCGDCHQDFSPTYEQSSFKTAGAVVMGHSIHACGASCQPGKIEALIK